jgi:hypothetical protein
LGRATGFLDFVRNDGDVEKTFARHRRFWVKLRDASDGAAHRKIEKEKGRANP